MILFAGLPGVFFGNSSWSFFRGFAGVPRRFARAALQDFFLRILLMELPGNTPVVPSGDSSWSFFWRYQQEFHLGNNPKKIFLREAPDGAREEICRRNCPRNPPRHFSKNSFRFPSSRIYLRILRIPPNWYEDSSKISLLIYHRIFQGLVCGFQQNFFKYCSNVNSKEGNIFENRPRNSFHAFSIIFQGFLSYIFLYFQLNIKIKINKCLI